MSEQMSDSLNVEQIMERIRERVRLRKQEGNGNAMAGPAASIPVSPERAAATLSLYDLSAMRHNVATSDMLGDQVGTINPRRPGWLNDLIQLAKKAIRRALTWYTRPLHEFHSAVTRTLNETVRAVEDLQGNVIATSQRVANLADSQDSLIQRLDALQAQMDSNKKGIFSLLDSGKGPKAREGLWFNEPIMLQYDDKGNPSWGGTHERIIERAWIFRHLHTFPPGTRVLDLGCAESILSIELASSGFRVTGVDARPYPLKHPNFVFVQGDICHYQLEHERFQAIVALSTIEHIGLGFYGDPRNNSTDQLAMDEIYRLLKPDGRLLMTVPYGQHAVTPQHRIYDADSLRTLLRRFKVEKIDYGIRVDEKTWVSPSAEKDAALQKHDPATYLPSAVAMILCAKARER
jgi:2-polyprenyl-3-methyl-5-hydroxy-6-metoxy-1,4-benzoquinol methylase